MADSFGARDTLDVGGRSYTISRLDVLGDRVTRLPFSLRILLENLLRHEDGVTVTAADIETLASWDPTAEPEDEIAFAPARVLMQDFTGVPCVVDLAAMRDAVAEIGGDIDKVNPLVPAELVIDHSIIADYFGTDDSLRKNADLEYQRNIERYRFLKWGQGAFRNFTVVPPSTGICHQVNLEYLARVVFADDDGNAYPDTVVGTDSHTTMINGLGVLGWGVGGIEAEAAMLGQPISMLTPRVVGFKLSGQLPAGATATDLVLTVTQLLRKHGVVGKFVEFYGAGVGALPLENRATIGNMSPEYGSTCAIFPIDDETLRYLRFTGRSEEQVALVEAYAKVQGLWHDPAAEPVYSEYLELDLATVEPAIAGPARPQDLIPLRLSKSMFCNALSTSLPEPSESPGSADDASAESFPASDPPSATEPRVDTSPPPAEPDTTPGRPSRPCPVVLDDGSAFKVDHGHVVIAAITSCTNTSNPSVMIAAGLLAKKAIERGLQTKPWVKTTLAPGSKVVVDYYDRAGLTPYLDKLRFNIVGFGCTTCIGNSGPILPEISQAVNDNNLSVASVLSGNRNFEGRINPDVRMNYLASPPLVVAYALAGTMDWDPTTEPFPGSDVLLSDIWPSEHEVAEVIREAVQAEMFSSRYGHVLEGDEHWQAVSVPSGQQFDWDPKSTYVRNPPYFEGMPAEPLPRTDITGARVLAVLGDSITTDHISPAGNIRTDGPAGRYLVDGGVQPSDFNSYGARRGNHEVMIRGTFANIRLRNRLAPGTEGGVTVHLPATTSSGDEAEAMSIYDASMRYQRDGVPLVVLAGKEYGSGSSRDWAAKGAALLGIKAVLAESFERIHRSNLIGMGVLPLELPASVESLGLTGHEVFDITGVAGSDPVPRTITVTADGTPILVTVRIDTPKEQDYYRHGGILQYVLRQMVK
jgi:aconitate hydratase